MNITLEMLEDKKACSEGKEWFNESFPDGHDYQKTIDRAVVDNHPDYAEWLINTFGATDEVLELEEFEEAVKIRDKIRSLEKKKR